MTEMNTKCSKELIAYRLNIIYRTEKVFFCNSLIKNKAGNVKKNVKMSLYEKAERTLLTSRNNFEIGFCLFFCEGQIGK